jgi:hypothetical protein
VVGRVVDHIIDGVGVLLLGLDQLRPETAAEEVVTAPVTLVEGPRIGAVEVAHAVGEVRLRCLEHEVVVVPHQALCVQAPAVATLNAAEDVEEHGAVGPVEHDRRAVVAARADVVEGAGFLMATGTGHALTVAPRPGPETPRDALVADLFRPRHVPGTAQGRRRHVASDEV